ncbi:MAG: hypothetical protein QHC40_02515 [Sphingobium sp.]|nr:hypothetical protein [Sphingobium sp.]
MTVVARMDQQIPQRSSTPKPVMTWILNGFDEAPTRDRYCQPGIKMEQEGNTGWTGLVFGAIVAPWQIAE